VEPLSGQLAVVADAGRRSDTAIPSQPPQSKLRGLLTKLKIVSP
jgi:hypothetical protein